MAAADDLRRRPGRSRGVVLPFLAVGMGALLAVVALVVDLGRLMLVRSELQASADACALSAVQELNQTVGQLQRAQMSGQHAASMVPRAFQSALSRTASDGATTVTFSTTGTNYVAASDSAAVHRFARCTIEHDGLGSFIGRFTGAAVDGGISATATATVRPASRACAVPLALDVAISDNPNAAAAPWGFSRNSVYYLIKPQYRAFSVPGLVSVNFGTGLSNYNVRLVDLTSSSGATSGLGLESLLNQVGTGLCEVSTIGLPRTNVYAPLFTATADVDKLWPPWNARFGLYQSNSSLLPTNNKLDEGVLPDLSGWAPPPPQLERFPALISTSLRVPRESSRFTGTSDGYQFHAGQRTATPTAARPIGFQPYAATGGPSAAGNHRELGSSHRRLVTLPIVRAASSGDARQRNLVDFACAWLYRPIGEANGSNLGSLLSISINGSPNYKLSAAVEFLSLASDADSPCRTAGMPGPAGARGPLVPALLQ